MMEEGEDFDAFEHRSSSTPASEDDDMQAQIIVFYPNKTPVAYRLHAGVNVIGRRSSIPERDSGRLAEWQAQFHGEAVHALFLESSSVSSAHAAIYLEPWREVCFVKDLGSRNKTFLRQNGRHKAIDPHVKCSMQSGGSLTFGALRCRISFGATFEGVPIPSDLSNVTRSAAMSISIRANPNEVVTHGSLDKCPSLQEWFRYPSGRRHSPPPEPSARLNVDGAERPRLTSHNSFGFMPRFQDEDHTSSDAEPVTPRIDRVAIPPFSKEKTDHASLNAFATALEPMMEDEKEGHDSDEMQEHSQFQDTNPLRVSEDGSNATNSTNLNNLQRPVDLGMRLPSPAVSLTDDEREVDMQEMYRGPSRSLSPLKRTRSDRINPERPRSKSPRLQRGFAVKEPKLRFDKEPSFRLEEMRDAVSNINT